MNKTSTPTSTGREGSSSPDSLVRELIGRITRFEIIVGAVAAVVLLLLVLIEPDILEAPFENERTLLFTFGGTVLAAIVFVAMLRLRVPAVVRMTVLVLPFAIVNWWLISPYFIDDVVAEEFSTSISEQLAPADEAPVAPTTTAVEEESTNGSASPATDAPPSTEPAREEAGDQPAPEETSATEAPSEEEPSPPPAPSGPVLLGSGQFVGLAGHSGSGDAGLFQNADGSLLLRFENFDIQNGPDLEVYLVPGSDQISLSEGSIHLGALKGNVGDQNYELPPGTELVPGAYTALVWCEAFSVEFVGATIVI